MNLVIRATTFILLLFIISQNSKADFKVLSPSNPASLECGDLLARYGEKQPIFNFVGCSVGEGQTILEAMYNVRGEHSEEAEAFLIKKYGLGKLTFTCCGWEPKNGKAGQIKNSSLQQKHPNYTLSITMFANAEQKRENGDAYLEKDRNKIAYFTVLVKVLNI